MSFWQKIGKSVKTNITFGLFLTIPIVTTVLIFNFLLNISTDWLPPSFIQKLPRHLQGYPLKIATLFMMLVMLYIVSILIRNFLGRKLYRIGDAILANIPLVRNIYITVRQISQSLFTQRKSLFKEVVLLQFPMNQAYAMGFVTSKAPNSVALALSDKEAKDGEEWVCVFIPTTPNPTSGFLVMAPRSKIVPVSMGVSDALTYIMSGGAVSPGGAISSDISFLDKLEEWLGHEENSSQPTKDNVPKN